MRRVSDWLLDSPRRFWTIVTAGVLVVVLAVAAATDPGPSPAQARAQADPVPAPTATPSARPTPSVSASTSPTVTVTERAPEPKPDRGEVHAAATGWVRAWLDTDQSAREWRAGMRARSTRTLADLMDTAQPTAVPRTRIERARTRSLGSSYALVSVHLANGERLDCSLVLEPGGWRVTQVGTGTPGSR